MKNKYLGIVAGMLLLAGCSNNDFTDDSNKIQKSGLTSITTVQATIGDAVDTRAYVVNDATSKDKSVAWSEDDEIFVLSDLQHYTTRYKLINHEDNVATFGGSEVTGSKFFALYPVYNWSIDEEFPNKVRYEMLNDVATNGNGFTFYAPMVAVSGEGDFDGNFLFKQATGMIHISIGNIHNLESVVLYGNDNEPLSGPGYIDMTGDDPEFRIDENPEWSYNAKDGWFGMNTEGNVMDAYFMLPVMTFEHGFRIKIYGYDANGNWIEVTKSTSAKVVVNRAQVRNFELVDVDAELQALREEAQAAEPETRAILKKFYDALDGDNWNDNTNWLTDAPLNEWYGLYFDNNGFLTQIYLNDNNLTGDIPAEIGGLSHLKYFDLFDNNITSIPEEISQLRYLEEIWLNGNLLTSLPASLWTMTQLRWLVLYNNNLSGNLPEGAANLTNLYDLNFSENQFEGEIPYSYFTNLNGLNTLNLYGNNLTGSITNEMRQSPMWKNLTTVRLNPQRDGFGFIIEDAVESIELNETEITLTIGESFQFEARVFPEDAFNKNVSWWSQGWSGNRPFSLNQGLITAENEGEGWVFAISMDGNYVYAGAHVRVVAE